MKALFLLLASCLSVLAQGELVLSQQYYASSAFSPSDIAGLIRWYDAQSIVGLNDGDAVASWTDKTGTTNLTAATSDQRPLFVASSSTFGNKACVHFDGSNDKLTNSSPADSSMTVFVVAYRTNTANSALICFVNNNAEIYNNSSGPWAYFSATGIGAMSNNAQSSGVVIAKYTDTTSVSCRTQSGSWTTGDPNDAYDDAGLMYLGNSSASQPMDVFVGEVLIYNSALSDANVNLVGAYLAARWNFTWTNL